MPTFEPAGMYTLVEFVSHADANPVSPDPFPTKDVAFTLPLTSNENNGFVLPMPTHRQALTELKVSAKIVDQSEFLDGRKGLILSAEHMHAEQRVYRDMVCTGSMRHLQ